MTVNAHHIFSNELAYPLSMLLTLFGIRLLSLAFFDGILIYRIAQLVLKAEVRV